MNEITIDYRILLPGESPREYRKHAAGLFEAYRPADYAEQCLIEEFAAASWVWRRARAVEASFLDLAGSSYNRATAGIAEALLHLPDKQTRNHRQYMLDAERRYERARRAVESIRTHRDRRSAAPTVAEPAPIRVRKLAASAASSKKRNEPNVPWTDPSVATPPARNEPKPPAPPDASLATPSAQNEPNLQWSDPSLATPLARNEPKLPAPPDASLATPSAQNEPNPPPPDSSVPAPTPPPNKNWPEIVVRIEPKPKRPKPERSGDRAMRRFLEIVEPQIRDQLESLKIQHLE